MSHGTETNCSKSMSYPKERTHPGVLKQIKLRYLEVKRYKGNQNSSRNQKNVILGQRPNRENRHT